MKNVLQQYQWFRFSDTLYVVDDAMYLQSPLLLSPLLQVSPLLLITVPSVIVPSATIFPFCY